MTNETERATLQERTTVEKAEVRERCQCGLVDPCMRCRALDTIDSLTTQLAERDAEIERLEEMVAWDKERFGDTTRQELEAEAANIIRTLRAEVERLLKSESSLRAEVKRLECEKEYYVERYYAVLDTLRDAPDLPPPFVLIALSQCGRYPEDWERGKRLQNENGFEAVPPKTECEMGAGFWLRVIKEPAAELSALRASEARLKEALEKIAGSHWERVGYCQTDIDDVPDMTAGEAMQAARAALNAKD